MPKRTTKISLDTDPTQPRLTSAEERILAVLEHHNGRTIPWLANTLGLTLPAASYAVHRLAARGFVDEITLAAYGCVQKT